MTDNLIAEHTIPGTNRTVAITFRPASGKIKAHYVVTREGSYQHGFNYLSCGRSTEAEAREAANFLWTDARDRVRALAAAKVQPFGGSHGLR